MSPIRIFPTEGMYEPQYLDYFQHTASLKHTASEDSPVEVATPPLKSKPTRGRQKRMAQNENAPRKTAWTNEEEIALCKGLVHVSENSSKVRLNVAQFCGVYANVMRRVQESGDGDEGYYARALIDYEAEHGMPFTLRHCWEVLKESGDASINLNVDVGD
ncbi:hypothetical protein Tco_0916888, partial [Tanacetum coccineum]